MQRVVLFLSRFSSRLLLVGLATLFFVILPPARQVQAASLFTTGVTLVRENANTPIWALVEGKKYRMRTPQVLASYGYQQTVRPIDPATLRDTPEVRLVYSTLGPRIYLLQPRGQKLWIPTDAAIAASGLSKNDAVRISHTDARAYRNAQLVRTADDPVVYYLDYTTLTRAPFLSESDFLNSGFMWADVVVAPQAVIEAYAQVNAVVPGTIKPDPVVSGTTFAVTSAPAPALTIPSGTVHNPVWKVDLTATKGQTTLTSITVRKNGFIADSAVSEITLVDENSFLLARPQRFSSGLATFTFFSPLVVPENTTKHLIFAMGFSPDIGGTSSSFSLALQQGDVRSDGIVGGSFPLASPTHTVIKANAAIGQVTVSRVDIAPTVREVIAGTTKQLINTFSFHNTTTAEDILIYRLTFTSLGGLPTDFSKFEVINEQGAVVTSRAIISGTTVLMDFGKTPFVVPRGEVRNLSLRADVIGSSASTSQYVLMNEYDVVARGSQNGYGISPVAGIDGGFPVGAGGTSTYNAIRILPGQVLVLVNPLSSAEAISRGADQVVLGTFDMRALGQSRRLDRLSLAITGKGPNTPLFGSVAVRIKGGSVISSVDQSLVMNKTATMPIANPPTLASGKTITFEIVATINELATTSDAYTVTISNVQFVAPNDSDRFIFVGPLAAPERAIRQLVLLVRPDPNFKATALIAGRPAQKVGRLLFRVGAGENVLIEQVRLKTIGTTPVRYSSGFSNLKLGSKSIAVPTGEPYVFPLGATVNANSEIGFDLTVDSTTAVDGANVQFQVEEVAGSGTATKGRLSASSDSTDMAPVTFTTTRAAFAVDPAFAGTAKGTTTAIGGFTVAASGIEDVVINKIIVSTAPGSNSIAVTRGYKNLRILNADTNQVISSTVATPVGGGGGESLSGPTIKAGTTVRLKIVIDTTNASAGDILQMMLVSADLRGKTSNLIPVTTGLPATSTPVTF